MQDISSFDDTTKPLHLMGLSPNLPFQDLNLAGVQGVPTPESLSHLSTLSEINQPTFTTPDTRMPPLAPYDLSGTGIDVQPAFAPDPTLPDLTAYDHPYGLAINPPLVQTTDPLIPSEPPNTLTTFPKEMLSSPLLPDLQHPDLTPQVQMQERPGDLDPSALETMHASATYQQLDHKTYPEVFLDQSGINTTRSRHMDLLMRGLDTEER